MQICGNGNCMETKTMYHCCGNSHCPNCGSSERDDWVEDRMSELLPTAYYHVVFTLPHGLKTLVMGIEKFQMSYLSIIRYLLNNLFALLAQVLFYFPFFKLAMKEIKCVINLRQLTGFSPFYCVFIKVILLTDPCIITIYECYFLK